MYRNLLVLNDPKPAQVNALDGYLMTSVYPVREGLAMMITNSLAGIRIDTWLIFERHMKLEGDYVRTVLVFVADHAQLSPALDIVRKYSLAVYGRNPIDDDLPF